MSILDSIKKMFSDEQEEAVNETIPEVTNTESEVFYTMSFVELTQEQKNILAEYTRLLRAWCGEQARTNNHAEALNSGYATVQSILGELQGSDLVTDGSGLAGASTLTKDEIISLTAHMQGVLTNYNTAGHRQMWAKAAGPGNLIG